MEGFAVLALCLGLGATLSSFLVLKQLEAQNKLIDRLLDDMCHCSECHRKRNDPFPDD